MDYVASALSLAWSTALATRTVPVVSPPLTADRFSPSDMSGARVVYLVLHSLPNQPYLYGDRMVTAMRADQIEQADLEGAVVYLAACYGGSGPIPAAFLAAGAAAVIADGDSNWVGTLLPSGANRLGRLLLGGLRRGLPAAEALALAKRDYGPRDSQGLELLRTLVLLGEPGARLRPA